MTSDLIITIPKRSMAVSVPAHVVKWLKHAFKLIRCEWILSEEFFQAWFTDGYDLRHLSEASVADFLLARRLIDQKIWTEHRSTCIVKMYLGSDKRYAGNLEACAKACRVGLDFAMKAAEDL